MIRVCTDRKPGSRLPHLRAPALSGATGGLAPQTVPMPHQGVIALSEHGTGLADLVARRHAGAYGSRLKGGATPHASIGITLTAHKTRVAGLGRGSPGRRRAGAGGRRTDARQGRYRLDADRD